MPEQTIDYASISLDALAFKNCNGQTQPRPRPVIAMNNHFAGVLTKGRKGVADDHIGRFILGGEFPTNSCGGGQFGFPVNGFHPQWSASSNIVLATSPTASPMIESSRSSDVVSSKISALIGRLRHDEEEKKRKRRMDAASIICSSQKKPRTSGTASSLHETTETNPHFSDLYCDVFLESNVAQLMVTPGGRVLAWNDGFLRITGLSTNLISESLTVFNLVRTDMIPRLFELFSLALRGGSPLPLLLRSPLAPGRGRSSSFERKQNDRGKEDFGSVSTTESGRNGDIDEDDENSNSDQAQNNDSENFDSDEDSLHASVNVPCVPFTPGGTPFNMTITLMNDVEPSKRCFHCIFGRSTPESTAGETTTEKSAEVKKHSKGPSGIGRIRRVSYASLASLL